MKSKKKVKPTLRKAVRDSVKSGKKDRSKADEAAPVLLPDKYSILDLKPTQFAVGMLEVDEKIAMVNAYSKKERKAYVEDAPVPVVISPQGGMFIVDHHHFLVVCLHVGIKKVRVSVVKDFSRSKMSYAAFWRWMTKNRSAYPYCQFGEGPRKPLYLPRDIRGLADDPYRSLAWFVRKAGAFENSDKNFAEFRWANFFRSRKLLDRYGLSGMPSAMVKAAKLAQSPAAKGLPGYGKLGLGNHQKVLKKVAQKGREIVERHG